MNVNQPQIYEDNNFRRNILPNQRLIQSQSIDSTEYPTLDQRSIPNGVFVRQQLKLPGQNLHPTFVRNIATQKINGHMITSPSSRIVYYNQPPILQSKPVFLENQTHHSFVKQNKNPQNIYSHLHSQPFVRFQTPANLIPAHSNGGYSQFRRGVSPMNSEIKQKSYSTINPLKDQTDMQKYESLRWQNKYEDLKTKYFQLLTIVQQNSKIQDSWIIQEQNKLLKQKIKVLQERDQRYYNQVTKRVQKMIDFHQQTTTKQCQLLMDRFRLQNKLLQKL